MGEVIEKVIITIKPDLEITVKGSEEDMAEYAGLVVSALRNKGLFPDVEMVPSEWIKKALKEIH